MKRFTKRILSSATVIILALASVVTSNAAGSYFYSEGFYYGVKSGEASVHGYAGTEQEVIIREKYRSYYVTEVEDYAFFENETVSTLSLYDATRLSKIGKFAFAGCVNLREVIIPSYVSELGACVFDGCTSLVNARFREDSAASVPVQAFYGCTALKNVQFENDVTDIGAFAFANCSSLRYLELPASVTSIAGNAFLNDADLTLGVYYGTYAMQYAIDNSIPYTLLDGVKLGDANADGLLNINDVTCIQRHLAQLEIIGGIYLYASDVNCDGDLDIYDATTLQMFFARYYVPYPIGEPVTQLYS